MDADSQTAIVVKCLKSTIRKKPSSIGSAIIDFVQTLSYEEVKKLTGDDHFLEDVAKQIRHVFAFLMLHVPSIQTTPASTQQEREIEEEDEDEPDEEEEESTDQLKLEGMSDDSEEEKQHDQSKLITIEVEETLQDGSIQGKMTCPTCNKQIIFCLPCTEGIECLDLECISSRVREAVLDALVKHPTHIKEKQASEEEQKETVVQ